MGNILTGKTISSTGKVTEKIFDNNYVHTDNNYTTEDKNTLSEVSEKVSEIDNKVDKIYGKGLSSNDFSDELKIKLDSLTSPMTIGGRVDTVDSLPSSNVSKGTVYLIGEDGSESYDEYLCIDDSTPAVWECIGATQVDIPTPDWNASDDEAGHIDNRTHWTDEDTTVAHEQSVLVSEMEIECPKESEISTTMSVYPYNLEFVIEDFVEGAEYSVYGEKTYLSYTNLLSFMMYEGYNNYEYKYIILPEDKTIDDLFSENVPLSIQFKEEFYNNLLPTVEDGEYYIYGAQYNSETESYDFSEYDFSIKIEKYSSSQIRIWLHHNYDSKYTMHKIILSSTPFENKTDQFEYNSICKIITNSISGKYENLLTINNELFIFNEKESLLKANKNTSIKLSVLRKSYIETISGVHKINSKYIPKIDWNNDTSNIIENKSHYDSGEKSEEYTIEEKTFISEDSPIKSYSSDNELEDDNGAEYYSAQINYDPIPGLDIRTDAKYSIDYILYPRCENIPDEDGNYKSCTINEDSGSRPTDIEIVSILNSYIENEKSFSAIINGTRVDNIQFTIHEADDENYVTWYSYGAQYNEDSDEFDFSTIGYAIQFYPEYEKLYAYVPNTYEGSFLFELTYIDNDYNISDLDYVSYYDGYEVNLDGDTFISGIRINTLLDIKQETASFSINNVPLQLTYHYYKKEFDYPEIETIKLSVEQISYGCSLVFPENDISSMTIEFDEDSDYGIVSLDMKLYGYYNGSYIEGSYGSGIIFLSKNELISETDSDIDFVLNIKAERTIVHNDNISTRKISIDSNQYNSIPFMNGSVIVANPENELFLLCNTSFRDDTCTPNIVITNLTQQETFVQFKYNEIKKLESKFLPNQDESLLNTINKNGGTYGGFNTNSDPSFSLSILTSYGSESEELTSNVYKISNELLQFSDVYNQNIVTYKIGTSYDNFVTMDEIRDYPLNDCSLIDDLKINIQGTTVVIVVTKNSLIHKDTNIVYRIYESSYGTSYKFYIKTTSTIFIEKGTYLLYSYIEYPHGFFTYSKIYPYNIASKFDLTIPASSSYILPNVETKFSGFNSSLYLRTVPNALPNSSYEYTVYFNTGSYGTSISVYFDDSNNTKVTKWIGDISPNELELNTNYVLSVKGDVGVIGKINSIS